MSVRTRARLIALKALVIGVVAAGCSDFAIFGEEQTLPPYQSQVDNFKQTPVEARDILWLIDRTHSMEQELAAIAPHFKEFVSSIDAYGISYQVGIITTDAVKDSGQLQGMPAIITQDTPDADTVFYDNLNSVAAGPYSVTSSEGFRAATLALDPESLKVGGSNYGFLRASAGLSMIVVSDGDDESPEDVDFYYDWMASLKGEVTPERLMFSAIAGPEGGCREPDGVKAAEATRYLEMVERMNGIFESICSSDFAAVASAVGAHQVTLTRRFKLSHKPVDGTLFVWVEDEQMQEDIAWTYDDTDTSIYFASNHIPPYGAEIEARYQTLSDDG